MGGFPKGGKLWEICLESMIIQTMYGIKGKHITHEIKKVIN